MTHSLTLIGYWIEVPGQILSAISETKNYMNMNESDQYSLLGIVGNGLQSIGEGIQGIDNDTNLGFIASFLEAAGAGTSTYSSWKQLSDSSKSLVKLDILGDSLQGIGAALSAEVEDDHVLILGNWLESIGTTLKAIGSTIYLKEEEKIGLLLSVLGSWLQVIGGASSLIYLSKKTN